MEMHIHRKLRTWWEKRQAGKQARLRNDFLPEAMEIVEKPASPLGGTVIIAVSLLALFFVVWAIAGRVDEVVSARGKIVSITGTQIIQTANGGVIKKICVKEGEHVSAGQELVILDASVYEITLQNTVHSIELLEYENELLQKLLTGSAVGVEEDDTDIEKAEIQKYVISLQTEYESKRDELLSEGNKTDALLGQQEEALEAITSRQDSLKKQRDILEKAANGKNTTEQTAEKLNLAILQKEAELEACQKLYEAGAITGAELAGCENELELLQKDYEIQKQSVVYEDYDNTLRMIEIEEQIRQADSEYASQKGAVDIAKEQNTQNLSNLATLRADYEARLGGMIVENQNRIRDYRAQQEIQTLDVVEQRIIAPVAGTVRTLDITTEGGVLEPAQQIAAIVPDDGQMMAEIEVLNKDIGYLENGQDAAMKLDTYNFQKYGKLNGKVVNISPDAVWSDQKGWIYKAHVAIDSASLGRQGGEAAVGIGMEGTVEVKVTDRAIIEFFLEPLVDHFDGSLKVR